MSRLQGLDGQTVLLYPRIPDINRRVCFNFKGGLEFLTSKGEFVYIPKQFEESRVDVMHDLIRTYPLATVVTHSKNGLSANHIPLHLSKLRGEFGGLWGHVARANPMLADIVDDVESLAIFHGPDAYISPSWYATKKEAGKVVPTWNYAAVHAYGILRVVDDASWLRTQLEALTFENEAGFLEPWSVSDAPPDYIDRIASAIVGVEMVVTRLLGKWKVSQNQPIQNRDSVVSGLRASDSSAQIAVAALVEKAKEDAR